MRCRWGIIARKARALHHEFADKWEIVSHGLPLPQRFASALSEEEEVHEHEDHMGRTLCGPPSIVPLQMSDHRAKIHSERVPAQSVLGGEIDRQKNET